METIYIYGSESVEIKYNFFADNRTMMKVWHQARLKVIHTAGHLYMYIPKKQGKVKKGKSNGW